MFSFVIMDRAAAMARLSEESAGLTEDSGSLDTPYACPAPDRRSWIADALALPSTEDL